jgi:serine protease Do
MAWNKKSLDHIIERAKGILVQIATPYSTGTGFLLGDRNLIITKEHTIRGHRKVVINGWNLHKQFAEVVFIDQYDDLALLKVPNIDDNHGVGLSGSASLNEGSLVIALGYAEGKHVSIATGTVSPLELTDSGTTFIYHNAILSPEASGGPLINEYGDIIGINTFFIRKGKTSGLALPSSHLLFILSEFEAGRGMPAIRCKKCLQFVFDDLDLIQNCIHCGESLQVPNSSSEYEPSGVNKVIEELLQDLGYQVELVRKGPDQWQIEKGSADILLSYHEETGLIVGDAYLARLPKKNEKELLIYLLKQNYLLENLSLSVRGTNIILSLIIYDRYLNKVTGEKLLQHLFTKADYYDNVLVEEFGAQW